MVTVSRQPTKLDYASFLQSINFLSFLHNIPDLTLSDVVIPTPFKPIPVMGQNLTYGNLSLHLL